MTKDTHLQKITDWTNDDLTTFKNHLVQGCQSLGIAINGHIVESFGAYARELIKTNGVMNLTAITAPMEVAEKHFIDSLTPLLLPSINSFKNPIRIADIGTGAGFPGLPLAIARTQWQCTLADSLQKRCAFLQRVISQLDITNIEVVDGRAEDLGLSAPFRENFDLVVARAVARLPVLVEYCLPFVMVGGLFLALKGPEGDEEVNDANKAINVLGGQIESINKFRLPLSENERSLILIRKEKPTPKEYPRKAGVPAKRPLS